MVERVNRFLKSLLKKLINDASGWKLNLNKAQYVINNTYHVAIKNTPAKILLGFDCRNHDDKAMAKLVKQLAQVDSDLKEERDANRDVTVEATEKLRAYNKTIL